MSTSSLDEKWYPSLHRLIVEDYEYLDGNIKQRQHQEKLFLQAEIKNPELEYPRLNDHDFTSTIKDLTRLRSDIKQQETNEIVRETYFAKIDEQLLTISMLQTASIGDDQKFFQASSQIYGLPDPAIYTANIIHIKTQLEEKSSQFSEEQRIIASRLQQLITHVPKDTPVTPLPNLNINSQPDTSERLSAEEIKSAFEVGLTHYKIVGWSVKIDNTNTKQLISVNQKTKVINIPSDDVLYNLSHYTANRVARLINHEIGVHIRRRQNGERSPLKLLGLGLDRYLRGEEGIAKFIEGGTDSIHLDHFLISLITGIDGTPRDFRSAYDILCDYYHLLTPLNEKEVHTYAWRLALRTFRGTTGQATGFCFTKNIVYREGYIAILKLLAQNPQAKQLFYLGKFDPTNERHLKVINELHLI
jgi:hypothetical protein